MLKFGFGVLEKTERGREEGKGFWFETGFDIIYLSYETDFADWTCEANDYVKHAVSTRDQSLHSELN